MSISELIQILDVLAQQMSNTVGEELKKPFSRGPNKSAFASQKR